MTDKIDQVLTEVFGHESFRYGQKEAIQSALLGQDTLVLLPTGSGKSICYQIFPYLKSGTTVIISPLLSLMQDQADKLREYGIKEVCMLNSLVSPKEKAFILKHLKAYKFILLSPEMLNQDYIINHLSQLDINLLVVDEAHCVSQWGMDFRPDYLNIKHFRDLVSKPPIMALTATAPTRVQEEIKTLLGFHPGQSQVIAQGVDRPEIKLYVEVTEDKDQRLVDIVSQIEKPGIIYFSSKKKADAVADYLNEHLNLQAESYHADKDRSDKVAIQKQFLDNQIQVVCATSAFGMGVNKADIKFVIHYHMPASPEMYLQEIGRCSRNKEPGVAILLYSEGDENIQRFLKSESIPEPTTIQYVYKHYNQVKNTDDVAFRLIEYFYLNDFSLEETIQYFNRRQASTHSQINYMLDLIYTDNCKRERLLAYFDEKKQGPIENCCNICQENLLETFKQAENAQPDQRKLLTSQMILKRLYNQDVS